MSAHTRVFWDRPPLRVMVRKWVGHVEGEHFHCMAKGSCGVGNGVDVWCYFLSLSWKGHYLWVSLYYYLASGQSPWPILGKSLNKQRRMS